MRPFWVFALSREEAMPALTYFDRDIDETPLALLAINQFCHVRRRPMAAEMRASLSKNYVWKAYRRKKNRNESFANTRNLTGGAEARVFFSTASFFLSGEAVRRKQKMTRCPNETARESTR